ncbi:carbohydrate ABC transporter permease [Microbacterium hydrocarbonoxydans]|uniref:carbohydrate ABC transporter permease n=1 Tax=Microbacterium hydrocarbonoxydans TaxID=273678 RepID=UPI00203FE0A3|nr:carbohydrate ABC transporter permease [Microbacterium hydrocarbonoxydans]MCM3778245.1 carbohydrate ABC transporter permease [Microbacterium hydrocarbonoxydans]
MTRSSSEAVLPLPLLQVQRAGRARTRRRKGTRRSGWFGRAIAPLIWIAGGFNVLLFLWVLLQSFRNGAEIFTRPFALPRSFNLDNYVSALTVGQLGYGFLNTIVVCLAATLTILVVAALAGQALSRTRHRFASPLTSAFVVGMGIPVQAVLIPVFVMMQNISSFMYGTVGWWDDRISVYLVYVATGLPFAVFLLSGFFRSLPSEVEEAAALDGAGPVRTFFQVMLPMARPGVTTAFILTLLGVWNETLVALVFITENDKQTLPVSLLGLYGTMQYTSNWGGLFAGVILVTLPILIAYLALGRRIVEGMTLGSGK